ncbi:MAG: hypothetical protein HON32_09855 [Francisellaceae bacterium]|nr:hypothetical protein [Francisellaceae bacterium]MBT6539596.1 hypothetical protein [Francisellaceae bacterium]
MKISTANLHEYEEKIIYTFHKDHNKSKASTVKHNVTSLSEYLSRCGISVELIEQQEKLLATHRPVQKKHVHLNLKKIHTVLHLQTLPYFI